jgi:hypothetical protein
MEVADVMLLGEYWREYPPTHEILAARYMKPKPKTRPASAKGLTSSQLDVLTKNFGKVP